MTGPMPEVETVVFGARGTHDDVIAYATPEYVGPDGEREEPVDDEEHRDG